MLSECTVYHNLTGQYSALPANINVQDSMLFIFCLRPHLSCIKVVVSHFAACPFGLDLCYYCIWTLPVQPLRLGFVFNKLCLLILSLLPRLGLLQNFCTHGLHYFSECFENYIDSSTQMHPICWDWMQFLISHQFLSWIEILYRNPQFTHAILISGSCIRSFVTMAYGYSSSDWLAY